MPCLLYAGSIHKKYVIEIGSDHWRYMHVGLMVLARCNIHISIPITVLLYFGEMIGSVCIKPEFLDIYNELFTFSLAVKCCYDNKNFGAFPLNYNKLQKWALYASNKNIVARWNKGSPEGKLKKETKASRAKTNILKKFLLSYYGRLTVPKRYLVVRHFFAQYGECFSVCELTIKRVTNSTVIANNKFFTQLEKML